MEFLYFIIGLVVTIIIISVIDVFVVQPRIQRYKFEHIEVGDIICTEIGVCEQAYDDIIIEETTEVVDVTRNEDGSVKEILLDNGKTIRTIEELDELEWFIC